MNNRNAGGWLVMGINRQGQYVKSWAPTEEAAYCEARRLGIKASQLLIQAISKMDISPKFREFVCGSDVV